jgi:hypothetical protein
MYALVYDNTVISGPRSWNKAFFEFSLKSKDIPFTFIPRNPPEVLPYTINDYTRIVPVEEVRPEINDFIEHHRGPLFDIYETKAVANYQVVENGLEPAKNNYKALLAEKRYEKEISGVKTTVQGIEVSLDTTRDGRNIFLQKYSIMGDADTVNWKFPEGWLTLTKIDLRIVVDAGTAYVQEAFDWEKQISDNIDAETNVQDLVKYKEIIDPTVEENDA